jgi:hypothetical protein
MPCCLLVPLLGATLAGLTPPTVVGQHDPPAPPISTVTVPVEVPVHDWGAEALRVAVAAAIAGAGGAIIGTRTTATRLRRRAPAPQGGLIDITDMVQSRGAPDEIQFGKPVRRPAGSR